MPFKKTTLLILWMCVYIFSNGCAYRPDRQQGQILEQEKLMEIKIGMHQQDILLLIGPPLLTHPFKKSQWIYTYYLWKEDGSEVRKNFIIEFDEEQLVRKIVNRT